MSEPIRVAMVMGKMIGGGVESVVMNYYRYIDKKKIQFDFIIDEDSTIIPELEIISLGGKIFRISPYQKLFHYMRDLEKVIRENKYEIVHSHMNTLSIFPLYIAKKCNVPIRIAHNHSTAALGEKKNFFKYLLRLQSKRFPTHFMAPTFGTGQWLFGKKIANEELFILKNAIDTNIFKFDMSIRNDFRSFLGYTKDDYIIGNVGRMVWQKNQFFVLKIFREILNQRTNAKLIIVGEGPLENEILEQIEKLDLKAHAKIISNTTNIQNYYQIMDVLLFPSNYEGFGNVAIEAQSTGLVVLGSERVPKEVAITPLFHQIFLKESAEQWARQAKLNEKRKSEKNLIENAGYNISDAAKLLQDYYINLENSIHEKS